MYFDTFESFIKLLHKCGTIVSVLFIFVLLGCENTRHSVGVTAKPFAKGDKMEDSVKLNYKIIFGKVRPKEDDDD
tara:strand:- start:125 stop:349 length:225 start_codon:yes stop_codon:yes gene_type:complete